MTLFTPPPSKYVDHFDQGKFNFTWRIFLILAGVFLGLTVMHIIQSDVNMYLTAGAFGAVCLGLLASYITKSYTITALIGVVAGLVINQVDLFIIVSSQRFVTILWIFCITLYAFYLLGQRWGILFLVLNLIGLITSLFITPNEVLVERMMARTEVDLISIVTNLIIIVLFLSYLMSQMLKSSKSAEQKSKEAQSELQTQYEIVQTQNEEKTVMLKEIHHRVKNNLQVITSLLRLQSSEIKDQKVLEHFDDAVQRVLAMALIHEKMYQSEQLAKIDLEAYLNSLAEELISSYAVEKPIELTINCAIDFIQPKSLVSFALMFNELIANTLKHAFSDQDSGIIKIDITNPSPTKVECTYFDNGTWKPPQKEGSFGVELISDLCEQLDGTYTKTTGNGTTYHFIFDYLNLDNS